MAATKRSRGDLVWRGHQAFRPKSLSGSSIKEDAAIGFVGVSGLHDRVDHAADIWYRACSSRLGPRCERVERRHVLIEPGRLAKSQIEIVHAPLRRGAKNVIVNISDVADVSNLVAAVDESTLKDVVGDVGGRVSKMGCVVGRDAAHIHAHNLKRGKRHNRSATSVIQLHVWMLAADHVADGTADAVLFDGADRPAVGHSPQEPEGPSWAFSTARRS